MPAHGAWRNGVLGATALAAVVGAWAMPRLAQDPAYHLFADNRTLRGIPNGLNVLSNLAFAFVGMQVANAKRSSSPPLILDPEPTDFGAIASDFMASSVRTLT